MVASFYVNVNSDFTNENSSVKFGSFDSLALQPGNDLKYF
jgi:hypothetical protein